MKNRKPDPDDRNGFIVAIWIVSIFALIFWVINWVWIGAHYEIDKAGQFGDRFGMSTSFFGALTIILLMITIHLQRKEIADGKKEFKQQNRTLKYQKFDNTFFNMMQLQYDIMESVGGVRNLIHFMNTNYITLGIGSFDNLRANYRTKPAGGSAVSTKVQDEYGQFVNHFRNTVKFIFTNKKKWDSQKKYLEIYAAQLNNLQKILLLYHLNLESNEVPELYEEYKEIVFGTLEYSNQINTQIFHVIYNRQL